MPAPALQVSGPQTAGTRFLLLRSRMAEVRAGEILRRFFSSPLLASGRFAAILFTLDARRLAP